MKQSSIRVNHNTRQIIQQLCSNSICADDVIQVMHMIVSKNKTNRKEFEKKMSQYLLTKDKRE